MRAPHKIARTAAARRFSDGCPIYISTGSRAPFKPIFRVATTRAGSGVVLLHDDEGKSLTANQPPPGGRG